MKWIWAWKGCITTLAIGMATLACAGQGPKDNGNNTVELVPRPYYLVADMDDGPVKAALAECAAQRRPQKATDFSISVTGISAQTVKFSGWKGIDIYSLLRDAPHFAQPC